MRRKNIVHGFGYHEECVLSKGDRFLRILNHIHRQRVLVPQVFVSVVTSKLLSLHSFLLSP